MAPPLATVSAPALVVDAGPRSVSSLPEDVSLRIDDAVIAGIAARKLPGCVVVVGRHDGVLLRKAYGARSLEPEVFPMTVDTVFDLASLTKPVATAASILVLEDRGKIDLDAPLRTYLPELGEQGRGTVRQALTHTAGYPADTPLSDYANGIDDALGKIARAKLRYSPGTDARYSDVGFLLLGEIVRRVSGEDLDTFSREAVFSPLGMSETGFLPGKEARARAAPTEKVLGAWLVGEVHDPRARLLGGVAGHAGLFSTADDLTRFAQAMLGGGRSFLSARARQAFGAPHDIPRAVRALGWDVRSPTSSNRGVSLSPRAIGHGGYTGTSLWIDPEKDLFVLFLSNRVHPDGQGAINPLAGTIADLAAAVVGVDETRGSPSCDAPAPPVLTGLDVLVEGKLARLQGAHVGLVTNATGRSRDGARDIDILASAEGVKLVAIFAPEHGLTTTEDARVADGTDASTGLPIFSLYGERFAPTDAQLVGIDTLVFDLPDVGTRFFTYASTLHRALRTAAARGLRFVVLDRPDPIDGIHVEGPVLVGSTRSFVNHASLPVRPGMTMGELALFFDASEHLGTALEVVRASGWTRDESWAATGLPWIPPSPNLRTADEALLYPGVGMLEATNVSVGRGTATPFEVLGAPWIDGKRLAQAVTSANLPGLRVEPTVFTPTASRYRGQACAGVRFTVTDRATFAPVSLGVALAMALRTLHPVLWEGRGLENLLVFPDAAAAIDRGAPLQEVEGTWSTELARFKAEREKYLLYPSRTCAAGIR